MKILMQSRPDLFDIPGGDTMQLVKTKEFLLKMGVSVDVSLELTPDLSEYDLVHLFNITRVHETYIHAVNALKQGKKYVISSIYWDYDEMNRMGRSGFKKVLFRFIHDEDTVENLKGLARVGFKRDYDTLRSVFAQWHKGFTAQRSFVLRSSTFVLPNSIAEQKLLESKFGTDFSCKVVYNAADSIFGGASDPELFRKKFDVRDFVICVGRFDERKNQLSLLRAWKGIDIPLVLIGSSTPTHKQYYKKCRIAAGCNPNILFIDKLNHDELRHAFAAAKVHVLPSWLETPGLSSLEAALSGCNIVVTAKGSTTEYFGDLAWYCDPNSIDSIRAAVLEAYQAPKQEHLMKRIATHYTWQKAAEDTYKAYCTSLKKCSNCEDDNL